MTDEPIDSKKLHDLVRAWLVSGSEQDFANAYEYADSGPNDVEYDGGAFCPWGEDLHFHHDGCPCCATFNNGRMTQEQYLHRMYIKYNITKQEINHV